MKKQLFIFAIFMFYITVSGFCATNPFAGGEINIRQSADEAVSDNEQASVSVGSIDRDNLNRAIKKLDEANQKYSDLLKKFAEDPDSFADENGDYRDFVQQMLDLAKRLSEVSNRLKEVAGEVEESDEEVAANDEEDEESKVINGTVKVNTSLNVRTSPWGTIIGSLYNNNPVKIIGKDGDWYKIDHNGQTAYIHANYVDTPQQSAGQTAVNRPSNQSPSGNLPAPASVAANGGPLTSAPCQPMPGRASSEFGWRTHPTLGTRKFHNGIDLPVVNGTRLNALGDGTVIASGYESGGGRYVKVRYANGYESFYCHLQSTSVSKGDRVSAGQEIARSDNTGQWTTGPHLHFGLKKNGSYVNPRSVGIPLP
ncbi:MAG: peptidoglycan DD-metalloendopeptidase family protein [Candidatus Rifleibacteriota bacterium]